MNGNNIEELDDPVIDVEESEEASSPQIYGISSYGADYDVDGLVKRLKRGDIFIPPFQRDYVWNQAEASRLVESLLLGLPVPGVFLAKESDSNKLSVIDGQQRLKSLLFFYEGFFNPKEGDTKKRVFRLKNVQEKFEGKTYEELEEDDRINLDDSILHATIIKQETPTDDNTSIYHVFERLNTGGRKLTPQEIRSAIYIGKLNDLISDLNDYPSWRELFGKKNNRLKDQEMILRFFAIYTSLDIYSKPLKEFLNKFNGRYRNPTDAELERLGAIFKRTADIIFERIGKNAFRPDRVFNAAAFEVLMVGIAKRIDDDIDFESFANNINSLYKNQDFVDSITRATSDDKVVADRHRLFNEYINQYVQ
ncbi:DUF262 domain-containing protein [Maribacter sp. ACAM166]|uniref:DUF262 domain-containing protein n=1 Tax=Maribacter sp. ACAM166 TaxID=2508996 RepID=UPI0010FF249E|nr:DUF262 domain-containing protein [Maribacter sp. ACAM166]TLP74152.1 DUF262 domain-containing protein [Maribacter sp. ACAM166]